MKIFKPKFWSEKNSFSAKLLYPISIFYKFLLFIKQKTTKEFDLNIPIICVGNIYLGGTGKTPLSILIAKELKKKGKEPAIIRKYYTSHKDEHLLIEKYFKSLILNNNRISAIQNAKSFGYDLMILDDGFQDLRIKKDVSIICFNERQLIGNGLMFPSGPLREDMSALKRAQIVMINGLKNKNFEKLLKKINNKIDIFYSKYHPTNLKDFKNKKLIALAGIGNTSNFFELLEENKLNVVNKYSYPDHYKFSKIEIAKIVDQASKNKCQIVMTEKDYYKINRFKFPKIKYLKVDLKIKEKNKFINKIIKLNDKNI